MHTHNSALRLLTELDFTRVSKLNQGHLPDDLVDDLNSADLVLSQDIASDVVTMNSRVELVFEGSIAPQTFTLCYPKDANPALGLISVLSPVGAALLGRRVGDTASWQMPQGEERSARVSAILFQPEACGDYTT